jgi:hypothetical protein
MNNGSITQRIAVYGKIFSGVLFIVRIASEWMTPKLVAERKRKKAVASK